MTELVLKRVGLFIMKYEASGSEFWLMFFWKKNSGLF